MDRIDLAALKRNWRKLQELPLGGVDALIAVVEGCMVKVYENDLGFVTYHCRVCSEGISAMPLPYVHRPDCPVAQFDNIGGE